MTSRRLALLTAFTLAMTTSVLAQGAGGGGGSGASAGASSSGTSTTGTAAGTGGTNQSLNPAAPQTNSNNIIANEQTTAVQGTKTVPMSADSGTVSAPGVGVGHAANGQPIGSPGSGLGSPENSTGPTR
jgi:hypothetical protein